MKSEEQDNLKNVITGRFVTAMDYLVDSGRVHNMVELEKITGIRQQRIAGMRASAAGESKNQQYVGIHQIKLAKDHFSISMDYIFDGKKPIVSEVQSSDFSETANREVMMQNAEMKQQISLLQQKIELLNEKVEFYKEVINQKP